MNQSMIKIEKLVEVPELKNFYAEQSNEDLKASIEEHGLRTPIVVGRDYTIIDGYRRVAVFKDLGYNLIPVFEVEELPTLTERIIRNLTRVKTTEDLLSEMREVFKKYPKKQGKRKKGAEPYVRDKKISAALGGRWNGDVMINKVETVLFNDIEGNILSKGILEKGWKVDPCHEYLTKWKSVDDENKYGFTKSLKEGLISINDVNKLIETRSKLDNEYSDTFVIPEKATSHRIDCIELGKIEKYKNSVDTIFTSVPYYILRFYDNGDPKQSGQEETKYEYCERIANYFKSLIPLLKETSNVLINIGETYDNGVGYSIPDLLKEYIVKNSDLIYKDRLVWSKTNPKPQNESVCRPVNNVEYILWFVVNPSKAKFKLLTYSDGTKTPEISRGARDIDKNGAIWDKNISLSKPYQKFYTHLKEQEILNVINAKTSKNHDVYKICKEGHPAIMSAVLPVVPILMTTDEGDTVLDPFAGTNVVGRVSCLLNRKALSGELSKKYYDIGCEMLKNAVEEYNNTFLNIINRTFYENKSTPYQIELDDNLSKNQILTIDNINFNSYTTKDGSILFNSDNIEILNKLSDNSIDSIVTDPPYHVRRKINKHQKIENNICSTASRGIMGQEWDGGDISFNVNFWRECLRVLKPGGHLLSFGYARTYHKMASAIEDAGFEVRDQLMWIYGNGFPKSHDLGKDIDKLIGNEREIIGSKKNHKKGMKFRYKNDKGGWIKNKEYLITKGNSKWEGWGTGLRPAHEPIVMARKPISDKSIAKNILNYGTGGINIEGCKLKIDAHSTKVKWPTNILIEEETCKDFNKYLYCPKANKSDKEEGLNKLKMNLSSRNEESNSFINTHPTIKPTPLMQHLVRLVTPQGGICLDPFGGSGSTAKACIKEDIRFILIEKDKEYHEIAKARIEFEYLKKQSKIACAA